MTEQKSDISKIDPVGAKAAAETIQALIKGVGNFLSRICNPAAEELGLLLRDQVRYWRAMNIIRISQAAEKKLSELPGGNDLKAHPRLVHEAFEHGSWIDDEKVQEMWGGLLASSCTSDGLDDSNLIFIDLLKRLTSAEARILAYTIEKANKYIEKSGLPFVHQFVIGTDTLQTVSKINDIHRLDRELDHLRSMELIGGGFNEHDSDTVSLYPTSLSLHLYVRCQGSRQSPNEFFDLKPEKPSE